MKEVNGSPVASSSASASSSSVESVAGSVVTKFWNPTLRTHFGAGLVTVGVVSLMIVLQIRGSVQSGVFDDIKRRLIHPLDPPEEVDMPQHWNYSSHEFLPIISDWDEQRLRWMEGDPDLKVLAKGVRPRVLVVTGSSQEEGDLYILSHLLLRAAKNKQDYTQMHDMQLYYNMINPDPEFSHWWVKLPVVRMLMLRHPKVEWIWWLDADAVFTDMTFEPPFAELDRYNLVLFGEGRVVHDDNLDPTDLNTGVFMIRNCQWSLDLLGAWANSGTSMKREESGDVKFQEATEVNRTGDDRSSLVALLAQDKTNPSGNQKWVPKMKLLDETDYVMKWNNWTVVGPKLEELSPDKNHVPFVSHFEGCLPHPSEVPRFSRQDSENFHVCVEQLERAFDFAENQVYKELGLERNTLGNSSEPFTWKDAPTEESTEQTFRILPTVTNWDEKRKAYRESKPWIKKDSLVILSGSAPTPCREKEGSHLLVRGLKNKIDYSRLHDTRIFYNMAIIHENLTGWWSKLPALKLMMINSIDVEWIWWTDSDLALTSMDSELPFERYHANGHNLVVWGEEHLVFDLKKYNGINAGSLLIRNCQWSLDLLDTWASLSNLSSDDLCSFLDRPQMGDLDDQSALVCLLVTEREKWASKVYFENDIVLSGNWMDWTSLYVDDRRMRADARPLTTHFAGCNPCTRKDSYGLCLERFDRTYNFADNQVLENYGLRHERLNSSSVTGDFQGDVQVWTDLEIERIVTESEKENLSESHEVDQAKEKEEVKVITKEEDGKVEPNQEQEKVAVTKEEKKVEPTKEQEEVTTTKEKEELEHTKEQDVVTKTNENQQVTLTKEEEQVTTTKEEREVKSNREEEKEVPTEGQGIDQTKNRVDSRVEEKVVRPHTSEPGNESPEHMMEAYASNKKVAVETKTEEKVDRPEEKSELGKGPMKEMKVPG